MSTKKQKSQARPAAPAPQPLTPDSSLAKGITEIFFGIEHELILDEGNTGKLARALVRMKRAGKTAEEIQPYAAPFIREIEKWVNTPKKKLRRADSGHVFIDFSITKADLRKLGLEK